MNVEPSALDTTRQRAIPQFPFRVLVVDDNRDAADSTAQVLTICGATAQACYNGEEALARLVSFNPDVCILDVNMPGINGIDLAECVQVMAGGKPLLVALTAVDDERMRQRIADGVFDLHFVKPADPMTLFTALAEQLAQARACEAASGDAGTSLLLR